MNVAVVGVGLIGGSIALAARDRLGADVRESDPAGGLPVVVDPSHAPGRRSLVEPLSLAAAAAGADGIIVEVHPQPEEAICDGPQQIRGSDFAEYAAKVEQAAALAGKSLGAAV